MHDTSLVHRVDDSADRSDGLLGEALVCPLRVCALHDCCKRLLSDDLLHAINAIALFEAIYDSGELFYLSKLFHGLDSLPELVGDSFIPQIGIAHSGELKFFSSNLLLNQLSFSEKGLWKRSKILILHESGLELLRSVHLA